MTKIIERARTDKIDKNKCYICDKYEYIAELHHLVTISDINRIATDIKNNKLKEFNNCIEQLNEIVEAIWLCPNHHTIYHRLLSKQYVQFALMLSIDERKKYSKLFEYAINLYQKIIDSNTEVDFQSNNARYFIRNKIKMQQTLSVIRAIDNS